MMSSSWSVTFWETGGMSVKAFVSDSPERPLPCSGRIKAILHFGEIPSGIQAVRFSHLAVARVQQSVHQIRSHRCLRHCGQLG